jgi:hypothetical protein
MHDEMNLINILAQEAAGETRLLNAFPQFHALYRGSREQVEIDRLPMAELQGNRGSPNQIIAFRELAQERQQFGLFLR